MKRLLPVAILALGLLPGAASAAGCAPLTCAPTSTSFAGTHLLALQTKGASSAVDIYDLATGKTRWQLPRGILAGKILVHKEGSALTWLNATTGEQMARHTLPAFTNWFLAGTSVDGKRAVLSHTTRRPLRTSFAVSGAGTRKLSLPGNWGFDALRGQRLYFLEYLKQGYVVRVYDLAKGKLVAQPVKNGDEGTVIDGFAWSRLTSWDGSYVFTLYINSASEAMIHELDVRSGVARCIDLPGDGDFGGAAGYGLALTPDGKTVWAASAAYGRVAAVDVASAKVRSSFAFKAFPNENAAAPAIALNPDGDVLALSMAARTWFLDLTAKKGRLGPGGPAAAIGFSPDGQKLWRFDPGFGANAVDVPG
jgi:hypothetical protein